MAGCGCSSHPSKAGPFSKGKELIEFVYNAHGGAIRDQPISTGYLNVLCQGCTTPFTLKTYIGKCPNCGGVHGVTPMTPNVESVQFAGADYILP